MDYKNYCLNIDKVLSLDNNKREVINSFYRDMVWAIQDKRDEVAINLFNTLLEGGYLINIRDAKLNKLDV